MSHVTYLDPDRQVLAFQCPGCDFAHSIRFGPGGWTWNGDRDKPTIQPSVLSNRGRECPNVPVCHSFVTNGRIRFLDDSTHHLAGQTVDLKPW